MLRYVIALACAGLPAFCAADTIELFGQVYRIQTLDLFTDVTWEDTSPLMGGTVHVIRAEGTCYSATNELFFSAQHYDDFGAASNQIVRAKLDTDACNNVTGIHYDSTIWYNDPLINGTDYEPSGVTINTGNTGLGAGGNLVFSDDENEWVHDVDLSTGTEPNVPFFTQPYNDDLEDIAYVPTNNQLYTLDQSPPTLVRFSTDGDVLGSFPIGADANPQATGEPKGLTFVSGAPTVPTSIRRPDGTLMVALESGGVGLQVFELDGDEVALEQLTDNGVPLLPGIIGDFQIASLAFDPVTGRIFLTNEGVYDATNNVGYDNLLWVLTPAIPGDGNSDGQVTGADYTIWADHFGSSNPGFEQGDFNSDGAVTGADYTIWADHFGQCGPAAANAASVPEPSTLSLALVGLGLLAWRGSRSRRFFA